MRGSTPDRSRVAALLLAALAALTTLITLVAAPGRAAAQDPVTDAERELAERYVPVLVLKEQEEPCDAEGEPYGPTAVDLVLDNPEVALRQVGRSDPVVRWAPGATDLFELGEGFFVDFPGSSLSPGCIYERDFDRYAADVPATVYAHVVQQADEPDRVFLQYWFYWYYNDWNNKHESDWEGITLAFDASTVEQALDGEPVAVGYSQHEGGERADWDADKLERDGDRPVVYSSAGSHASYFGSALYLGRSASEGFGCDNTDGPSFRVDPEVVVLPDSVDDPDDPLAWLAYGGRWGERQSGPFNGPTGPAAKDRWLEPAPWFDDLRPSSVVIPTGDSQAASVIGVFCDAVERGSGALISFTVSPARTIVGLIVVALLVVFFVNRTDWSRVALTPIVRRRRAGQIVRGAGRLYGASPGVFLLAGLVYVPAAIATGLLAAAVVAFPLVGSLVSLAGSVSGTSIVTAALVGSVANVAAFVAVSAIVADYLHHDDRGVAAIRSSARRVWDRRRDLITAFVRSFLIVFVLFLTIVGVPWGIRQLVRYQFAPQAVMVDGRDGRGALARSTELVRGRWWHTAVVAAALNGLVTVVWMAVALLVLIVASGLPLWVFSAIVSLVSAVVVPVAAIGFCLLHGDAVAERDDAPRAEPVLVG